MKAFAEMWRDIGIAAGLLSGGSTALLLYAAQRRTRLVWKLQDRMALIYLDNKECRDAVREMGTIGCKHVFRLCAMTGLFACVFCHRHENLMADVVQCPQHKVPG